MRSLSLALLCTVAAAPALAIDVGPRADAVLFQENETATQAARTNAGGFGGLGRLSVGGGHVWVADTANRRVLAFRIASLAQSGDAVLVLGQRDMSDVTHAGIPAEQAFAPAGATVDTSGRVFVWDATRVLVFENPITTDVVFDAELAGLPADIQSVRTLSNNRLVVVGSSAMTFYLSGETEPLARFELPVPCGGSLIDATSVGDALVVLCGDAAYAYPPDSATGFVSATYYQAYNGFSSAVSVAVTGDALFVSEAGATHIVRFGGVSSHLSGIFSSSVSPRAASGADFTFGTGSTCVPGNVRSSWLCNPGGIAIADDVLWIADRNNYRVLGYNAPATTSDDSAGTVIGQPNFVVNYPNRLEGEAAAGLLGVAIARNGRVFAVDRTAHRVAVFPNVVDLHTATGSVPERHFGQSDAVSYRPHSGATVPPLTQNGLYLPTHVAVDPGNSFVYISDTGNRRIVVWHDTDQYADRVIGAPDFETDPSTGYAYGALAIRGGRLFVAVADTGGSDAHRVFMYDVSGSGAVDAPPSRVFGQATAGQNLCNRGGAAARADTLCDISGVAIDVNGRLWVADRGNRRVVWFDDPAGTDPLAATTADGVVGQPDMVSSAPWAGDSAPNRAGFNRLSAIAVGDDGTLIAADSGDSRVLCFVSPMSPDMTEGMPLATRVLGQKTFTDAGANNSMAGANGATLSSPTAVAIDSVRGVILVSDAGNNRLLRFYDNAAPVIEGAGTFNVAAGSIAVVTLSARDLDADPLDPMELVAPAPSGATLNDNVLSFDTRGLAPGTVVHVHVRVTDTGPRRLSTTAVVTFVITDDLHDTYQQGRQPAAREPKAYPSCAAGTGSLLVALLLLVRRRR
jgi:sugar lactone lactonase YvrE